MAWKLFQPSEKKTSLPAPAPLESQRVKEEVLREPEVPKAIPKAAPVKVAPKERWIVVKEYPMQPIKRYVADDGTMINLITEEDFTAEQISRELNGD